MGFAATMIFYHVIGLGVATAVYLLDSRQGLLSVFRLATAVVFWPLYLPIVLTGARQEPRPELAPSEHDGDAMSRAISQVQDELEDGTCESRRLGRARSAHEAGRFRELGAACAPHRPTEFAKWTVCLAERNRRTTSRCPISPGGASDRYLQSEQTRRIESRPASRGSKPSLRGLDGHTFVGARAGLDDSISPNSRVHPPRGPKSWWPRSRPPSRASRQ